MKDLDNYLNFKTKWGVKKMAGNNILKGFDEKEIFSGKGLKELDEASDSMVRKFKKGELNL